MFIDGADKPSANTAQVDNSAASSNLLKDAYTPQYKSPDDAARAAKDNFTCPQDQTCFNPFPVYTKTFAETEADASKSVLTKIADEIKSLWP